MVRLQEQYEQAVQFRKRGFTYAEIAKIVGVSRGTVSNWLAKQAFSKQIKEDNRNRAARENSKRIRLLNKARGTHYRQVYSAAERSAELEYKHFKDDPLFIAGVMLYMDGGDISSSRVMRVTSARKAVHRIFVRFVLEYLGVSRENVRFWLLLYHDQNEAVCVRTWSKALELSKANFYKTQVIQSKSKKERLHHGVGNTIIGSAVLKHKLLRWVELASEEF